MVDEYTCIDPVANILPAVLAFSLALVIVTLYRKAKNKNKASDLPHKST